MDKPAREERGGMGRGGMGGRGRGMGGRGGGMGTRDRRGDRGGFEPPKPLKSWATIQLAGQ
jgi:hypothetical protein